MSLLQFVIFSAGSATSKPSTNTSPTADDGTLSLSENTTVTGTLSAHDTDSDTLVYKITTTASHGTATITNSSTGAFNYVPTTGYNGTDSFKYSVNDGKADSNTATITITITAQATTGLSFINVTQTELGTAPPDCSRRFDALFHSFSNDGYYGLMIYDHETRSTTRMYKYDGSTFTQMSNADTHYYDASHDKGTGWVTLLDVNGDGKQDFWTWNASQLQDVVINDGTKGSPHFETAIDGLSEHVVFGYISGASATLEVIKENAEVIRASDNQVMISTPTTPSIVGQHLISDLTGNTWPDILCINNGGYLSNNSGTLTWTSISGLSGTSPVMLAADLGNSGFLDLIILDSNDGSNTGNWYLWKNNGDGTFTNATAASGIGAMGFESYLTNYGNIIAADLDNNGFLDIVAAISFSNGVEVWQNNGDYTFTKSTIDFGSADSGAGSGKARVSVADYNNDGLLDILKTQDQTNFGLWKNTTNNTNHWMKIRCRGNGTNTDGLHTHVYLYKTGTNELIQHMEVAASQQHPQTYLHMGCADNSIVDIKVQFPHGGDLYKYNKIATNQELIVYSTGQLIQHWQPGDGWPLKSTDAPNNVNHPRLLMSADDKAAIQENKANLKSYCDVYLSGTVEYPDGDDYPNAPNIGSGYQGEEYIPKVLAFAMYYLAHRDTNEANAKLYGNKAVDILMKMADPYPSGHGINPLTDSGYGIRNYGVSFGLAYDWIYPLLTTSQKTKIVSTALDWVSKFEASGYGYTDPVGNYFVGYMLAKTVIIAATYEENENAEAMWHDVLYTQIKNKGLETISNKLAGGGWQQGYGNYAPQSIRNIILTMMAVKTCTGENLFDAYDWPFSSAKYAVYFTWPSLDYMDDRDTNHSMSDSVPGTLSYQLLLALGYAQRRGANDFESKFRWFTNAAKAALNNPSAQVWEESLFHDSGTTTVPLTALPKSYKATGINSVSVRSDWTTDAKMMTFRAGPYIGDEEYYDQGSMALINGDKPFVVNASGWVVHNPGGDADENRVYDDVFTTGNCTLFNIFFCSDGSNKYGQSGFSNTSTHTAHIDKTQYTYTYGSHIEKCYVGSLIQNWDRGIIFVRPDIAVVFDNTTVTDSGNDQWMAWAFSGNPTASGDVYSVTYGTAHVGTMTCVLPKNTTRTLAAIYPASDPAKAWQVQIRDGATSTVKKWLTVFDMAATARTSTALGSVGVQVGNDVAVVTGTTSGVTYPTPSASMLHICVGLSPNSSYDVSSSAGSTVITAGTTYTADYLGTISYTTG